MYLRKEKRALLAWLFTLPLSLAVQASPPANEGLDGNARRVWDYLQSIYGKKTLSGYNVYVHTPDDFEQTGLQAAVWGRDLHWLGGTPQEIAAHARRHGYILTLHWHWHLAGDSAWTGKRKEPVDVGRVIQEGTPEHRQLVTELAAAADVLAVLRDAGIPVLWRPLHEIDGGWFWWTDTKRPEHTAALWRLMYDYFTHERELNNLIWVYSAGIGKKPLEYRKRFYPGARYVDISGIDIYGVDFSDDRRKYWDYHRIMSQVSPGKMLALGEADAIPDPDEAERGRLPPWLYVLPWWGAPSPKRPVEWARFTMRHGFVLTLDEIPALGPGPLVPQIGILEPRDDGSAWYVEGDPVFQAYAVDRDGEIAQVAFYANAERIATLDAAPFVFTWRNPPPGSYDVSAIATDNEGNESRSNVVRVSAGQVDLARGRPVIASSGHSFWHAVDGDYHTAWSSAKSDREWIYVDLGKVARIDRVNLFWGWKIHPAAFSIDVALENPELAQSWRTVHQEAERPYRTWEAIDRISFEAVPARYVRLSARLRAGRQTWGGYQLMAFEVPVLPTAPTAAPTTRVSP